jgi:hypothetical protein
MTIAIETKFISQSYLPPHPDRFTRNYIFLYSYNYPQQHEVFPVFEKTVLRPKPFRLSHNLWALFFSKHIDISFGFDVKALIRSYI